MLQDYGSTHRIQLLKSVPVQINEWRQNICQQPLFGYIPLDCLKKIQMFSLHIHKHSERKEILKLVLIFFAAISLFF
jgi:hypothetical protein